jgi:TonB family protein
MAVIRNYNPQLAVEPTLVGAPQTVAILPDIPYGDPNGVLGPLSNGTGKNGGIGKGDRGGIGGENGPGHGDGPEAGVGSPGAHIVGSIKQPVLLTQIDPEYTDEARMAKVQGIVILHIDVDTHGRVRNIRLVQGLGMGLDEQATKAVSQWTFKPGAIDGKPAVTSAVVHVTFRLL